MALRLLIETAGRDKYGTMEKQPIDRYLREYYDEARNQLDKNDKTTIRNQVLETESGFLQILQNSAHSYNSSFDIEQTMAMSILIGNMLLLSHPKDESK